MGKRVSFAFTRACAIMLVLALLLILLPGRSVRAAAKASTGNCNWSDAGCWSPSGAPTATDDVQILGGHTVTLDAASVTVNSLTVNADGAGGTCGLTVGANSITVTNNITFNANNNSGTCQIAISSGSVSAASLAIGGGNYPSQVNMSGNGTMTISGAVTINPPLAASTTDQIAVGTGTFSAGSLAINGGSTSSRRSQVTLSTGTVTVGGDLTFGSGTTTSQQLIVSGAGTVNIGGNFGAGGSFTPGTGTVQLNGAGNQTFGGYSYYNLTLGAGGVKTPVSGYSVANTLTIDSAATLDESAYTLTLPSGTIIVNGTLDFSNSNGLMRTDTSGTSTLAMGANGLIRTADQSGLGPGTGASLQTQIGGAWDVSSLSTNGTVEYYRYTTSGQTVTDCDYNNLVITGSAQTKAWNLTAPRTIHGNLTINTGAPLNLSGAQALTIEGNWSNNGTFNAGTGTVIFGGNSAQTIGGSAATTFNNLTVNNASDIFLDGVDATVNGTLTFLDGKFATGSNILALGSGASIAGAGVSNYIYGKLQKPVPTGSPALTFEVGDASIYAPISVTFSNVTTGGTLIGSTTGAQHPAYLTAGISSSNYVKRYWSLPPANLVFSSYNATFTFDSSDVVGSPSSLIVQKYDGTSWSDPASSSYTSNTVTGSGFTSFSDFFAGEAGVPTPVSLSYFKSERSGDTVNFDWSTDTESGNVGFNLYATSNGQRVRLNEEIIPSRVIDSLNRQDYLFSANANGEAFYLEEVSMLGERRQYGPFLLGQEYGSRVDSIPIDWDSIAEEHGMDSQTPATIPADAAGEDEPEVTSTPPTLSPDLGTDSTSPSGPASVPPIQLTVRRSGLYRVTYEMLHQAGFDLAGVPSAALRLSNRGRPIPIYVKSAPRFGPGSYIEFIGEALDTIYTDTNVYTLQVGRAIPAAWIPVQRSRPEPNAKSPNYFLDTVTVNNQRTYANYAPGNDAWYDTYMMVYNAPQTWDFPFQVTNLAKSSAADLHIILWGLTQWSQKNDHHFRIHINGATIADLRSDGFAEETFDLSIPPGTLTEGQNDLQITLVGDTGVAYDVVVLDSFSVTYPRALQAEDGRLKFTAAGKNIRVTGLPSGNVRVYRLDSKAPVRLANVHPEADEGTFTIAFAGTKKPARYFVTATDAIYAPEISAARQPANLDIPAQYVIISHPDFIGHLQPLIEARRAQGLSVNVVDVGDLYARYTYGIFDPDAIRKYIAYARKNLGAQYILLVGGDTYDYRDYLGAGSVSFIPSLYTNTGTYSRYSPTDPLYADVNSDNVPDLAIGRFPVRTTAELDLLIQKTLAYANKDYGNTAAFASDQFDGSVSYKAVSDSFASALPPGWAVRSISLDDTSVTAARAQLLDAMNSGTALVTFTGHTGPTTWSYLGLFNTSYANSLTNAGRPFVAIQWGCWNAYYVDPIHDQLVHSLLVSGDRGAAAILGETNRTNSDSGKMLGQILTPRLVAHGQTIGQAVQLAKQDLARSHPNLIDVLLGFTIMGDPALEVTP